MNPWLRLLVSLVVIIGGVFVLRLLPGPVVLALFAIAVVAAYRILRSTHEREPAGGPAEILGLRPAPNAPSGLGGYPLALFARGNGGRQSDVMDGRWGSLDVLVFDHVYAPSVVIDGLPGERAFTCALTRGPRSDARVVVEPEAFMTPMPDRAPLPPVELGLERFDAAFDVRSDDPAFVEALLDRDVTSWLLGQGEPWGLEIAGGLVMVYAPANGIDGRREVLDALGALMERIPAASTEPTAQPHPQGGEPGSLPGADRPS
jgi:hypothetical protein